MAVNKMGKGRGAVGKNQCSYAAKDIMIIYQHGGSFGHYFLFTFCLWVVLVNYSIPEMLSYILA